MLETKTEIKTVINAKFDKIEAVKYHDESNKKYALKKQLDLLWQDFLEKNKAKNHFLKNIKDSYKLPYHHGYLKIHITKTEILTRTLHLYLTVSKHPLKTHHKHQKTTEKYHLIDWLSITNKNVSQKSKEKQI